ncbi:MAG: Rhodanese domain protein [Nitrospirae bacterium]|nr:Rhodanese domain protein [Nitrospirota bacterium]MBS1127728.1 Rhodanese domain protein [Nitrospirota bacterium]MBS1192369.1 Rhodanese domain protein [Nitrospirota bacterium]MBS1242411.1 Rhodanese domain protein [Nitrospirota bacterium]
MAVATGKVDGMVYAGGLLAGMFVYAELSPVLSPFVNSTSMGQITIPQYFNLPVLGVVVAVVMMALVGFYGAGILEKKFGNR